MNVIQRSDPHPDTISPISERQPSPDWSPTTPTDRPLGDRACVSGLWPTPRMAALRIESR